ncbi:hypothetical protein RCL1_004589 [Eukaryota sp. TZLM3-RCL]
MPLLDVNALGQLAYVLQEFLALPTAPLLSKADSYSVLDNESAFLTQVTNDFLESYTETLLTSDVAVSQLCRAGTLSQSVRLLLQTTIYRPSYKELALNALIVIIRRSDTGCLITAIDALVTEHRNCQSLSVSFPKDVVDDLITAFKYRSSLTYPPLHSSLHDKLALTWRNVMSVTGMHPFLSQAINSTFVSVAVGVDLIRFLVPTSSIPRSQSAPCFNRTLNV